MRTRHDRARAFLETALALTLGAGGGALLWSAGVPLAWLLGAMFATAAATLAGLPVAVPPTLRSGVIAALGMLIGAGFQRERFDAIWLWLPSATLLAPYVVLVGASSFWYLRRIARIPPHTAFFAAAPGGLSEMVLLSHREGADMRTVALVHAMRVLTIVAVSPLLVSALGAHVPPRMAPPRILLSELVVMVLAGLAGALTARRLRMPAPDLLGPMLVSAGLHLSEWMTTSVPAPVVAFAQLTIGASIGSRFRGLPLSRILRHLGAGLVLTMLMLAVTGLFAAVLHLWTGLPMIALVLAYVPGGVVEMGTIALALGVDPAFVTTHHLLRITLVVLLAPTLFPLWRRYQTRAKHEDTPG